MPEVSKEQLSKAIKVLAMNDIPWQVFMDFLHTRRDGTLRSFSNIDYNRVMHWQGRFKEIDELVNLIEALKRGEDVK